MSLHHLSASQIADRILAGELRSVDITEALIARRREVDDAVNAFTDVNHNALDDARAADVELAEGRRRSALHGVPITIKDNVDIAGFGSTLGLRSRQGKRAVHDSVVVAELRRAGAVILGKTNVPQLLLAQETANEIHGTTRNPWNGDRVPGGSSGGEGAALATGMSPLGIGTDIGGSIRIPAHFCGIAGFKPTLDRWSNRGSQTAMPGQEVVRAQIGPLARTVGDLELAWRTLSVPHMAKTDPQVSPLPTGDARELDVAGLRIGVYEDDDLIPPMPSMVRAVKRARQVLQDAGATLIPFTPTSSVEVLLLWMAAITADGGTTLDRRLAGETVSPQLKTSRAVAKVPAPARKLAGALLGRFGEARLGRLIEVLGRKPVETLWELTAERSRLRLAELDHWNQHKLDALLCPAHVVPAMRHLESGDFTLSIGPAARWSLLNFPAGVVPVTRVSDSETQLAKAQDRVEARMQSICLGSAGLPVGVQVVSRPFREEAALAVMLAIEGGVSGDREWPRTPIDPVR